MEEPKSKEEILKDMADIVLEAYNNPEIVLECVSKYEKRKKELEDEIDRLENSLQDSKNYIEYLRGTIEGLKYNIKKVGE